MSDRAAPELRDLREAWELIWGQMGSPAESTQLPDASPSEGPDPYGEPDPEWLKLDWNEHLRTVEVGSTRVNYAEMGPIGQERGPDVVLVHGLAGCWQNWLENIPALARHRRVLALDLPGFGHSPMPPWEISIPAYGRLVHDFCDAVDVGDAAIAGNSMGGFVAAEAVINDQARFGRLALISAAGISSAAMRREPAALAGRLAVGLAPLALNFQEAAIRRPKLRHSAFRSVFHRPTKLRAELLHEQYSNGTGRPGFLPALTALTGYDFIDHLAAVETETLIVWGRNDLIVPPTDAVAYAKPLRNSQTVIFDQTGHCPMLERPVRFNRLLESFLTPDDQRLQ